MKRFRLLQCCNRHNKGHIWVCPWLRDNKTDIFDEWIVLFKQPLNIHAGVDYYVDISFKTRKIAITPIGSMVWVFFASSSIACIRRPNTDDYQNLTLRDAPYLPWVINGNFSAFN